MSYFFLIYYKNGLDLKVLLGVDNLHEEESFGMKSHMKDASPLVIRLSNNIEIDTCVFNNNSAIFNGDFYFGAAVTLDSLLGMGDVSITDCTFTNHQGMPPSLESFL